MSDQQPGQHGEQTTLNAAFVGFYASCTLFGLSSAVATSCLIVFGQYPVANWIGALSLAVVVISGFSAWYCLKRSRRE